MNKKSKLDQMFAGFDAQEISDDNDSDIEVIQPKITSLERSEGGSVGSPDPAKKKKKKNKKGKSKREAEK